MIISQVNASVYLSTYLEIAEKLVIDDMLLCIQASGCDYNDTPTYLFKKTIPH